MGRRQIVFMSPCEVGGCIVVRSCKYGESVVQRAASVYVLARTTTVDSVSRMKKNLLTGALSYEYYFS